MDTLTPVKDIMTKDVIALHLDDTLKIVDKTFDKHHFHHIPILDSKAKVVGMISKEDILRLISVRQEFTDKEFGRIKVKDFMSDKVVLITPEDSVGLAADMFITNHFHALPVVFEDGNLAGIVTTHDLIKYAYKSAV